MDVDADERVKGEKTEEGTADEGGGGTALARQGGPWAARRQEQEAILKVTLQFRIRKTKKSFFFLV